MDARKEITWPGWDVVGPIGRGSFGTVYEIQRDVYGDIEKSALKVITLPRSEDEVDYLRCSGLDDASITQTFHQQVGDIAKEYKLMAQLRENPNIVRCEDFRDIQHDDGLGWDIYLKMELLTPLMKCLKQLSTEEQIIRFGMDICNALIDCQKKNIIHRDIKPQNVFVSKSGRFKLGDFGIARTIERTTHATVGVGTYSYMAPEVKKNEPYGKTVDIYSLGLMLYWLLNERRGPFIPLPPAVPIYTDEEQAWERRFSGEQIPPPKNGSKKLKAIVLRACSFKPEDRFQSAEEFYEALINRLNEMHRQVHGTEKSPASASLVEIKDVFVSDWDENTAVDPALLRESTEKDATVCLFPPLPEQTDATVCLFPPLPEQTDATVCLFSRQQAQTAEPQKTATEQPATEEKTENIPPQPPESKPTGVALPNGSWKCACGRTNAAYVSSCTCGINKHDITLVRPKEEKIVVPIEESPKSPEGKPIGVALPNGSWRCACRRTNAAYVSSCTCGINKHDITLVRE